MKKILFFLTSLCAIILGLCASIPVYAQQQRSSNITGMQVLSQAVAAEFGKWSASAASGNPAAGSATISIEPSSFNVPDGLDIQVISTRIPLRITGDSNPETVTPSAVNCSSGSGICTLTATFASAHPNMIKIGSGTFGLQEAIEFQHGRGGIVLVTTDWAGTTSMIVNALGYTNVSIRDLRLGSDFYYTWDGTDYVVTFGVDTSGSVTGVFANAVIINNIRYCNAFSGATAGEKMVACIASIPSTGGTADARGIEGAQSWGVCPFTGVTKPVNVWMGVGTATLSINCTVPVNVGITFGIGSIISVNGGVTLTINGSIMGAMSQTFAGAGAVLIQ